MNWTSRRTSPLEKFSSSGQRGMRAWICSAKALASPRCSRWASCCETWGGRGAAASAMARPLCPIRLSGGRAPVPHRLGEHLEERDGGVPAEATVGDALPEDERLSGHEVLPALDEVRLDHGADEATIAFGYLSGDVPRHFRLALVFLGGVRVRAVDHHPLGELRAGELLAGGRDGRGVVVGRLSAAQDDVAVVVAASVHDRHLPALV